MSRVCVERVCQAPYFVDNLKNGDETDVDCGGSCPTACADGQYCIASADCLSQVCAADNTCRAAECGDGIQNGDELAIDCGGRTCAVAQTEMPVMLRSIASAVCAPTTFAKSQRVLMA